MKIISIYIFNITVPHSSGCSIAVTEYMMAIETKNKPVGVRKVP